MRPRVAAVRGRSGRLPRVAPMHKNTVGRSHWTITRRRPSGQLREFSVDNRRADPPYAGPRGRVRACAPRYRSGCSVRHSRWAFTAVGCRCLSATDGPGPGAGGDHMGVRSQVMMVRKAHGAVRTIASAELYRSTAPGLTSSSAHIATGRFHRVPAREARKSPAAGGVRSGRPCASARYARRPVAAARCCPRGFEVESVEANFCVILPCSPACRGTCSAHRRWHWCESRSPAHRRGLSRRAMGAGREYVMDKAGGIER